MTKSPSKRLIELTAVAPDGGHVPLKSWVTELDGIIFFLDRLTDAPDLWQGNWRDGQLRHYKEKLALLASYQPGHSFAARIMKRKRSQATACLHRCS